MGLVLGLFMKIELQNGALECIETIEKVGMKEKSRSEREKVGLSVRGGRFDGGPAWLCLCYHYNKLDNYIINLLITMLLLQQMMIIQQIN